MKNHRDQGGGDLSNQQYCMLTPCRLALCCCYRDYYTHKPTGGQGPSKSNQIPFLFRYKVVLPCLKQPQKILLLVRVRRRRGRRRRRRNPTKRAERIDRRRRCPHRRERNKRAGRQRRVPKYQNGVVRRIRRRAGQDALRRRLLQHFREPRRALMRRLVVKVQQVFCHFARGDRMERCLCRI